MRAAALLPGAIVGLALAAGILAVAPGREPRRSAVGPVVSDSDAALDEIVVHWAPGSAPVAGRALKEFLGALAPDVTVRVVCPGDEAYADFTREIGRVACRLRPVLVDHAMTGWSRDRWLALTPESTGDPIPIVAPRREASAEVWPARAGDARVSYDLDRALGPRVVAHRSALEFDGGDFVADGETVFVTPSVLRRNVGLVVRDAADLTARLERLLGRRVVLLPEAPDHHAGMFMMPIGGRRVLVGDPGLARPLVKSGADLLSGVGGPDFTEETRRLFDSVARTCVEAGYRVVRTPVIPSRGSRAWLTPLNAILERRAGRRVVYMPIFDGPAAFDDAAEVIWMRLGFAVIRVNCSDAYRHGGSLRCLVNVLARRFKPLKLHRGLEDRDVESGAGASARLTAPRE